MASRNNENILAEMKISFDGSEYGKTLYREAKKKLVKKPLRQEMIEFDKFMNSIEGVPSPIREEAFVIFCLRNSKRACAQVRNAA